MKLRAEEEPRIHFRSLIHQITEEGSVFRIAIMDGSDNVTGYEDAMELVPADSTIISISQVPRTKQVRTTDGLESTEGEVLVVDENYMTILSADFVNLERDIHDIEATARTGSMWM